MSVPIPNGLPCMAISALSPPLLPPGVRPAIERRRVLSTKQPFESNRPPHTSVERINSPTVDIIVRF